MASRLAPEHPMDDRIKTIVSKLKENLESSDADLPGLIPLLDDYLDHNGVVNQISFMRGLLRVFRDSPKDETFQKLRDEYTIDERKRLERFVDGASPEHECEGFVKGLSLTHHHHVKKFFNAAKEVVERILNIDDEEELMEIRRDLEFQNHGETVFNTPKFTCVPRTVADIQKVVNFAKASNLSVRCAGYRHSWSPIFGRSGEILISTLPVEQANDLPNLEALTILPEDKPTELETIQLLDEPRVGGKRLVRLGRAVTDERLRRWCINNGTLTMPYNAILVEITAGGGNASICHGAGRAHQTMSDLVRCVEYVDANGTHQKITESEPDLLRAAAGAFGLLGVVTHLTFELSPMSYAILKPTKIPVIQAVPPPDDMWSLIPPALLPKEPLSAAQKKADLQAFEDKATNDYFAEWFWFPYADESWVNCWNPVQDPTDVEEYPDKLAVFISFLQEFTLNVLQYNRILDTLADTIGIAEVAVTLLSRFTMLALPDVKDQERPTKTYLCDGLHYQRAIHNIRVRDLEVEIPLQPSPSDPAKPDFEVVRRAWWDAILKCYEHSDTCPQRFPLEMRIMGDSNITLSPQRGNNLGTCAIEILTLQGAVEVWQPYAQEVLDKWMSYTDAEGKKLRTRPHWAKEWFEGYTVDGRPWIEKLKDEDYKVELEEFRGLLGKIGERDGWALEDLKERFSNELFDGLVFDVVAV